MPKFFTFPKHDMFFLLGMWGSNMDVTDTDCNHARSATTTVLLIITLPNTPIQRRTNVGRRWSGVESAYSAGI